MSGTQNPGNSPGVTSILCNATYTAGAAVVWQLAGNTELNVPLMFDQIDVSGDLSFTGPTALYLSFYDNDPMTTWTSVVDWSDPFWNNDHSWVMFAVSRRDDRFRIPVADSR